MVRVLRRLGYRFALVSGGFSQITDRLADDLGIHYSRANELEIVDGTAHRPDRRAVVDRAGKAAALQEFADAVGVPLEATIAIGDGANDLDMLNAAGLGIAFNAKQVVRDAADTSVNVPYLDAIMYLLGISREEIEAADADAGIVTPAPPLCQPAPPGSPRWPVSAWKATSRAEVTSRSAQSPSYSKTASEQVGNPRLVSSAAGGVVAGAVVDHVREVGDGRVVADHHRPTGRRSGTSRIRSITVSGSAE